MDIVFLQETHSTTCCEKLWSTEWGSKIWFDHGDSRSRGSVILFSKNLDITIHNVIRSDQGRYIILYATLQGFKTLIVNVYAPNKDSPAFFETLFTDVNRFSPDFLLMAGDINLALDTRLDRSGKSINNDRSAKLINQYIEEHEVVDIWRTMHPDKNGYTWRKLNLSPCFSRLDYFFCLQNLLQLVDTIEVKPGLLTDHSIVQITLVFNPQKRGPGYWKFNNSLLQDKDFLDKINQLLDIELGTQFDTVKTKWENIKLSVRNSVL